MRSPHRTVWPLKRHGYQGLVYLAGSTKPSPHQIRRQRCEPGAHLAPGGLPTRRLTLVDGASAMFGAWAVLGGWAAPGFDGYTRRVRKVAPVTKGPAARRETGQAGPLVLADPVRGKVCPHLLIHSHLVRAIYLTCDLTCHECPERADLPTVACHATDPWQGASRHADGHACIPAMFPSILWFLVVKRMGAENVMCGRRAPDRISL